MDLTCQSVELQNEHIRSLGWYGKRLVIEALLLGAVQQRLAQVLLGEQQVEEVGSCNAVKRFGACTKVQSSLKNGAHPLGHLETKRPEINVCTKQKQELQKSKKKTFFVFEVTETFI